jgi:hypothetical protein
MNGLFMYHIVSVFPFICLSYFAVYILGAMKGLVITKIRNTISERPCTFSDSGGTLRYTGGIYNTEEASDKEKDDGRRFSG